MPQAGMMQTGMRPMQAGMMQTGMRPMQAGMNPNVHTFGSGPVRPVRLLSARNATLNKASYGQYPNTMAGTGVMPGRYQAGTMPYNSYGTGTYQGAYAHGAYPNY